MVIFFPIPNELINKNDHKILVKEILSITQYFIVELVSAI